MEGEIYKHDTCGKAGIRYEVAPVLIRFQFHFLIRIDSSHSLICEQGPGVLLRRARQDPQPHPHPDGGHGPAPRRGSGKTPHPWPVAAARSSERTDCGGQAVGLTAEEAKATIREISKLHAEYWGCAQDKAPHIKTIGETTARRRLVHVKI